jgi:MSHA biogenesis protein MshL
MATHRLTTMIRRFTVRLAWFAALASMVSCSAHSEAIRSDERLIKAEMARSAEWKEDAPASSAGTSTPDFVSVSEEIVPLKTKMVTIVVRNSSLGDVLHVVAEASGLNLLIDREVFIDQPVTLSLRNVSAEDALKSIFSSVDCFYTVTNNVLRVESLGTKVFELGHPALVNTYSIDVGGDILGGAMNVAAAGASGGGSSSIKGNIQSGSKSDSKAYDFWDALEKTLDNIMGKKELPGTKSGRTGDAKAPQDKTPNQPSLPSQTVSTQSMENPSLQSITINRLTGTIMVTATRKNMEKVERYIENVRRVLNRQVMIEARIIEVQLNEGLNFGIDWSFLKNIKQFGGPLNTGFGALNLATTTFNDATAAAASSSKFQVGVSRGDFQALLTALKTQGDVKTLSNPKINVMNGHSSILTVGRNTSFISKVGSTTSYNNGAAVTTYDVQTNSVLSGLMVGIVPYISETGEISLNITPITSDLVTLTDKSVGAAGNQTTISIPTVDLREMTTTVKMRDGQMVIIGGLISKKETSNEEKIPLMGDIPFLGKLFTRTNNSESRSELVLLLRPRIVSND